MIGWKRIVVTVGERIGKTHMTYAQGASAEIVAMATIGAAELYGLPVSTTHVLSSGVAGTMVANHSGLQWATVRNLLMAWVLTLAGVGCTVRRPVLAATHGAVGSPRVHATRHWSDRGLPRKHRCRIVRIRHVAQIQFRRVLQEELQRGVRLTRLHGLKLAQVVPIHRENQVEACKIVLSHLPRPQAAEVNAAAQGRALAAQIRRRADVIIGRSR